MIIGIGIDLAKVERFQRLLNNKGFLKKYFHEEEVRYIESKGLSGAQSMAARFAAREAFFKALGTGFTGYSLKDIKIINNNNGRPEVVPGDNVIKDLNNINPNWKIHLTMSHEKEYAIAQVILEA